MPWLAMDPRQYFDVNGSTPLDGSVAQTWVRFAAELWGNASAAHPEGARARAVIDSARARIARGLGARPDEIWFTSGGTESNNWALFGAAQAAPAGRRHLLVSGIEHKSVLRTAEALGRNGIEVEQLPVGASGAVRAEDVERALRPTTLAVALMLANNETGVIQPVAEVAALCRARGALLHCDAVAAIGKIAVDVRQLGCDLLSLSGHKLYAPKGVGILYVKQGTAFDSKGTPACDDDVAAFPPLIHGCGQQKGMRSGTENTPGIAALGTAFERLAQGAFQHAEPHRLRDRLWQGIQEIEPRAQQNGSGARLPNTLSVAFPGRSGAELQSALGALGFSVAAGAAASNGTPSHVLLAMGLGAERARSTLRFSLGAFHDGEAIEQLLAALREVLQPRSAVTQPVA
jgi:cysteine desulfurase